jgi:hypothetical protein
MKSIFAVVCNQTSAPLHNSKFFISKESAQKHLKKLADERRYNMGVDCWKEDKDSFSYLFGWEEVSVKFAIVELPLEDGDKS